MGTALAVVVAVIIGLLIGGIAAYFYVRGGAPESPAVPTVDVDRMVAEAQAQQKEIILEAKEEAHGIRTAAEQDARERRTEVQRMERRITQKEENLDRRGEGLDKRERQITTREEEIETHRGKIDELIAQQQVELARVSGLTRDEATAMLMASIEVEVR